jgi:hypothetical protein
MALILGFIVALVAVLLVLQPLLSPGAADGPAPVSLFADSDDEDDPALARKGRALAALKEIDFDLATGKLSDEDYAELKARFTLEALEALKAADRAATEADVAATATGAGTGDLEARIAAARAPTSHVPRPASRFCVECGAPLESGARFCLDCGAPIGALTH